MQNKHLIFGTGRITVARGKDHKTGSKYLFLHDSGRERTVGSGDGISPTAVRPAKIEDHDVVVEFTTLASARVLADKLNLLVCQWDEELAEKWDCPDCEHRLERGHECPCTKCELEGAK